MTEDQIKHMVDRFLSWKLPEDFNPDAGISFDPTFNKHLPVPPRHDPIGTNLFSATQAEVMVRHMIEGMPIESALSSPSRGCDLETVEATKLCAEVEADAVSALRYIETHYGRLSGIGWDRVFDAHDRLFAMGRNLGKETREGEG